MSDFDKEAERERLREKFERDEAKRANTKRMSELLLQGATMTNRHCDTCGDPIFRYEDEEFCPTCRADAEAAAQEAREAADADERAAATGGAGAAEAETTEDADDAGGPRPSAEDATADADETPTEPAGGRVDETVRPGEPAGNGRPRREAPDGADPSTGEQETNRTAARSAGSAGRVTPTSAASGGEVDGDLNAARESLVRTLSRHARAAEESTDPRRASDHLAAVREAAEAIRALDGR